MKVTISYSNDEAMLATLVDQTVARILPKANYKEETAEGGFLRRIVFLTKPPSREGRKAIYKTKNAITQNRKAENGNSNRSGNPKGAKTTRKNVERSSNTVLKKQRGTAANNADKRRYSEDRRRDKPDSGSRKRSPG